MGLEWHNRKRSKDGRFAKRAEGLREAGIEIDQLHVRISAEVATEVRELARNMQMEISELVEVALQKMVDDIYVLAEKQAMGSEAATDGPAADQQRTNSE